jgi:hypothetical protein
MLFKELPVKRLSHALLAVTVAFSLSPSYALAPERSPEVPQELQLLSKPNLAMLCGAHLANLANLAQRSPTGPADEAVVHSGRLFGLALVWLPLAAEVRAPARRQMAQFVVDSPESDIMTQAGYCAAQANFMLTSVTLEQRAQTLAIGMLQAYRVALNLATGN